MKTLIEKLKDTSATMRNVGGEDETTLMLDEAADALANADHLKASVRGVIHLLRRNPANYLVNLVKDKLQKALDSNSDGVEAK